MSAHPRGPFPRTRSSALLVPLLAGLLMTSAPAVAAPVEPASGPPAVARAAAAEVPSPATATLDVQASSTAVGVVELAITVRADAGDVDAGTVTVTENGATLAEGLAVSGGAARYAVSGVAAGAHVYTVAYSGADGVGTAESVVALTVRGRAAVTLTATASSPAAHAVDLAVAVAAAGGVPVSGTVGVIEGGEVLAASLPVSGGEALFHATDVTRGAHTYTLTYSGDDQTDVALATVQVTVRGETLLTATPRSSAIGQLELTIGVTADGERATGGTVTISEGGKTVRSGLAVRDGQARWSATGLKPGQHSYTVSYGGTTGVDPASSVVRATVRDKATAELSVGSTSSSVGRLVVTVGVTAAGVPVSGGTVKLTEGSTTVKSGIRVRGGRATWTARGVRSGKHTYTVGFSGTAKVRSASVRHRATVKAKVRPVLSLTATSSAPKKATVKVVVTAAGQARLGGSVRIKEGSKTRKAGLAVKAGRATWSASGLKPGKHTYTVSYGGTSQVTSGSAKVSVTVMKPVAIIDYANCTELNQDWRHGVGRPGAVDRVSGSTQPVTNFLRNAKLYAANSESDRDGDGIACERL